MAKRKRRSFWEPDNKQIVEWLNSQSDLGKSLQIVAYDAMRRYGDGDVVQNYLDAQFESGADSPSAVRPEPGQEAVEQREKKSKPKQKQKPEATPEQETTEAVHAPEPIADAPASESEETPIAESEAKAEPQVKQPETDDTDDDDFYNPMDAMMSDVDSRFDR